MDGLSSGGVSDEETQASMPRNLKLKATDVFLHVADPFWDDSALDWDEVSPVRRTTRANSSNSSCWSPGEMCRPTVLSFVPGETAHFETHTPDRPTSLSRRRHLQVSSTRIVPHDLCGGEFDCQGIPWSRFSISRSEYRAKRVREYSNYNNVNWTAKLELQRRREIDPGVTLTNSTWNFYETFKSVNPTIDHFQLRHLLCSTSGVTSYYVSNSVLYSLNKSSLVTKKIIPGNPQQLACMAVGDGMAAIGGFDSELTVRAIGKTVDLFKAKMSAHDNSITNHVEFVDKGLSVLVANNDHCLTSVDLHSGTLASKFKWHSAVNHVSTNGEDLICLAGDTCDASVIDRRTDGETAIALKAHLDYVFCSSWKTPTVCCTGSQDGTCRLWDIRKASMPLTTMGTLLGAVRSAKFSANGKYLAFSEPADFVHVYETETWKECQVLDFFGNIGGIAFSPDSTKLSVAVADTMFGCITDFQLGTLPINTFKQEGE